MLDPRVMLELGRSENGAAPAGGGPEPFRLLSCDDLLDLPDPVWLIDAVLPAGQGVIYGPPSTFKSFIALDMAMSIASGLPWQGRDLKQGHVVYVAAEGVGGLKLRTQAWRQHREWPRLDGMHFVAEAVNLLDKTTIARTAGTLEMVGAPVVLLVIDTMARSMVGGDENSARDVGLFIHALDCQDVMARLIVHHTGADGERERGSTALRGASDMVARAEREEGSARVRLVCDKPPKDGEPWAPIEMRRERVASSVVLEQVAPMEAVSHAVEERRKKVLAFVGTNGPVSQNKIVQEVGGNAAALRDQLSQMVLTGELEEVRRGNTRLYDVPRPQNRDEVGTRS